MHLNQQVAARGDDPTNLSDTRWAGPGDSHQKVRRHRTRNRRNSRTPGPGLGHAEAVLEMSMPRMAWWAMAWLLGMTSNDRIVMSVSKFVGRTKTGTGRSGHLVRNGACMDITRSGSPTWLSSGNGNRLSAGLPSACPHRPMRSAFRPPVRSTRVPPRNGCTPDLASKGHVAGGRHELDELAIADTSSNVVNGMGPISPTWWHWVQFSWMMATSAW